MSHNVSVITCHDCGLLQRISHMPEDGAAACNRCDAILRKRERIKPAKSIEHTLALVITALVLFTITNVYPIIAIESAGIKLAATLFDSVSYLFSHDMKLLAGLVFLTSIGAPLIQLTCLLYILLPLNFNHIPWLAPQVYRVVRIMTSWSMLEVLMLGILVSVVKLSGLATVIPGIALWTFGLLIFFVAAILTFLDTEMLWELISSRTGSSALRNYRNKAQLTNCHNCNLLCTVTDHNSETSCPRCSSSVH